MATGAQARGSAGPSRRRVPRFHLQAPLDVTVSRSGIADLVPGRSINLGERGIAVMLAGELVPGETVNVEVPLPLVAGMLRTRAMVRYHDNLRYGLEFVGLSAKQRAAIREWAKKASLETEVAAPAVPPSQRGTLRTRREANAVDPEKPRTKRLASAWVVLLVLAAIASAALWWRWNRTWKELETGPKSEQTAVTEKPQAQVPAEVMEKLLIHRVEPVYPPEARRASIQGVIVLDIVVGRDGSVVSLRALNGPEVLARAAMDALRWWKFQPYRVNGEPVIAETTVGVEFRK